MKIEALMIKKVLILLINTPLTKKFATRLAWRLGAISLRATFQRYEYFVCTAIFRLKNEMLIFSYKL